jgi:outer membrane receptor protein involved in Fe transport
MDVARTPGLRKRISVAFDGVTLKEALTEIAQKGSLGLVYSRDVVSLDSPVHFEAANITVAGALSEVLLDAGVDVLMSPDGRAALIKRPVAAALQTGIIIGRVTDKTTGAPIAGALIVLDGTTRRASSGEEGKYRVADVPTGTYTVRARYIGYAPGEVSITVSADQEVTADFALEKSAQRLDEVVTTGTVVPTEVRALPTPISIISGDELQEKGYQRVDQVFRGDVPGAIAWDQGPGTDYFSSIAVRGASALVGVPSVKTFIDGVEVADPNYIATIDPNGIDRIEITRGPQASTLYGAGALSGVMQIFTKKGRLGLERPEVIGKVSAGGVGGFDDQGTALQTDNTASVLGGGEKTSYSVGGSYRHTGEWVPSYNSTDWAVSAGAQTAQGPFTLSGSTRYADKTLEYPWDTRLASYTFYSQPFHQTNRLRQQTYGLTASLQATRSWQHTLTLGYDQSYSLQSQTQPRFTTPADSFLFVVAAHEAKTSLLYHTDVSLRLATAVSAILTGGINHDSYDLVSSNTQGGTRTTGSLTGSTSAAYQPWNSTGYFGQVQLQLADRLFLSGGLRAEQNENFGENFGTAWSPRVGAAYIVGVGPASVKLRGSYGESIRAPSTGARDAQQFPGLQFLANPNLAPERQRGLDGGVEIYLGRASVGVTYYNQRAINLIQLMTIPASPELLTLQYQNIARVKNEGWEFEGQLPLGPVQLAGTFSITNSKVQELPPDYPAGGYQVGDRILAIPYTSAGATITYSPLPRTALTASMTYIGHWMEHDWVAEYGFFYGGQPYRGSDRAYWIEYPSVTKFAIGISQKMTNDLTAFGRVENAGNTLRYESSNSNIPLPRRAVVGLHFGY